MCNACGNYCCGGDTFGACGCDGCPCYECWSDDLDDGLDDEVFDEEVSRFTCEALPPGRVL